jgi:hypothetical protein
MAHMDSRLNPHSTRPGLAHGPAGNGATPRVRPAETELSAILPGDRAEGVLPRWDSLWIDLGGEG